jgi:hypothetical protein
MERWYIWGHWAAGAAVFIFSPEEARDEDGRAGVLRRGSRFGQPVSSRTGEGDLVWGLAAYSRHLPPQLRVCDMECGGRFSDGSPCVDVMSRNKREQTKSMCLGVPRMPRWGRGAGRLRQGRAARAAGGSTGTVPPSPDRGRGTRRARPGELIGRYERGGRDGLCLGAVEIPVGDVMASGDDWRPWWMAIGKITSLVGFWG